MRSEPEVMDSVNSLRWLFRFSTFPFKLRSLYTSGLPLSVYMSLLLLVGAWSCMFIAHGAAKYRRPVTISALALLAFCFWDKTLVVVFCVLWDQHFVGFAIASALEYMEAVHRGALHISLEL